MLRIFDNLIDVVEYARKKHPMISAQRAGGYGLVLLKKHNGSRIIVQEMRYFRIYKCETLEKNGLIINNLITGLSFKGGMIRSASSTLYLCDLVQVNVYDHSTHFISRSGLDFVYVEEEQSALLQGLQEFIHDQPAVVRASWTDKNADEQDLLDAISFGQKRTIAAPYRRNLMIDSGDI